jgi:hypothetical protein
MEVQIHREQQGSGWPARRRSRPLSRRPPPRCRTPRRLGPRIWTPDQSWWLSSPTRSRLSTEGKAPAWAAQPHSLVPAELIAEVQVATQVDLGDLRPTGPPSSAAPPKPGNSN